MTVEEVGVVGSVNRLGDELKSLDDVNSPHGIVFVGDSGVW